MVMRPQLKFTLSILLVAAFIAPTAAAPFVPCWYSNAKNNVVCVAVVARDICPDLTELTSRQSGPRKTLADPELVVLHDADMLVCNKGLDTSSFASDFVQPEPEPKQTDWVTIIGTFAFIILWLVWVFF